MDSEHIECKQCKFVLKISSKFCSDCGSKVSHEQTAVTSLGPGPSQAGDACASDGSLSSNKRASGGLIPPTDPPVKVMKMIDNEDKPKSKDADQAGNKATPVDATKDWKSDSQEQDSSLLTGPTDVTPAKSTDPKDVNDNDSCTNPSNQQEPVTSCQEPEASKPGGQGDGMRDISNKTTCQADDGSEHQVLETSPDTKISSEDKPSKPSEGANKSTNEKSNDTATRYDSSQVGEASTSNHSCGADHTQSTPSVASNKKVFGALNPGTEGVIPKPTDANQAVNEAKTAHAASEGKSGSPKKDARTKSTDPKDVTNGNDTCTYPSNQREQGTSFVQSGDSKSGGQGDDNGACVGESLELSDPCVDDKADKNKKKDQTKPKNAKGVTTRSTSACETVEVHFTVALSKADFSFEENKDELHVRFQPRVLGGFSAENKVWRLKQIRDNGKMLLFTRSVPIPKHLSGAIPYKYVIKKGPEDFQWEFFPKELDHRMLYNVSGRQGVRHQYDGAVHAKQKNSFGRRIKAFFSDDEGKKLLERTKDAVGMMLPLLGDFCTGNQATKRGEDILKHIEEVCECVKPRFYENHTDFVLVIQSYILNSVKGLLESPTTADNQPNGQLSQYEFRSRQMAAALIMTYLIMRYGCEVEKEVTEPLCKALLPKIDKSTSSCPEVEMLLKNHFPKAELQKKLSQGLVGCMEMMCTESFVETSWLYMLPMHHFLGGEVRIFEKPHGLTNHKTSGWWGVSQVEKLTEAFKRKNEKHMPLSRYIEVLSPLFKADYLLPRSVLAVMSLDHLPDIYDSCKFPVDALLAILWYHTHVINESWRKPDLREILSRLSQYLERLLDDGDPQQLAGSRDVLTDFALQVVNEVFTKFVKSYRNFKDKQEVVFAVQVAIRCIELQTCLCPASECANRKPDHVNKLVVPTEKIIYNMLPHTFYFSDIMENLKIFGAFQFPSKRCKFLGEEWTTFVTGIMRKQLKGMDVKDLLQAYCGIDSTTMCPSIEATLSAVAFESVETASHVCQAKCATSSSEIDITDDPQSLTHAQSVGNPGEIMTDPVHSMDVVADGQDDQHMTEETTGARGKKDSNMVTILSSGEDEEPDVNCDSHLSQSSCLSLAVPEATRSATDLSSGLYEVAPQLTATSLPSHINYVNNPNPDRKGGPEIQVVDDPLPPQSTVANHKEVSSRKMSSRRRKKRSDHNKDEKKDSESTKKGPQVLKSSVKFVDVGGNDATLTEVCRMLVHLKHPEIYKQLGVTPPRGFLLHGPPGCGKTLLAHAIAGELDLPFIKLAATEVVSGVSGESEEKICSLFEQAIAAAPCIMFIDEIDAISPKRETASKDMERRIVSQLLTCMDDLSSRTSELVLVIGATNRPDSIDPALRRAGRFDREICLGIPDENARERILQVLCRDLRLISDFDYSQLAHKTPGYVGADLTALVREAAMSAVNRVFRALQETRSNPHPSVLPLPSTSNQTRLQHSIVNSDSTIQSYDLPALNSDPTAIDDPRHQCATASLNETSVAAESAGDVSDMVNSSECGVLQMDISSCSSMKDLSTIGDKVLSGEFVTQPEMCEPTKGDSILPIAAEITESSSRKEEHLPSEKLHKERHEFESILLWLKEHPPLTDEQLSDLFIMHDDFISALQHVQPSAKREGFATVPDVTWDDIGALQEVREELQMAILAPVKHRAQFKAVGLTSPPGVLLAGPPGCGKTLLAKAIANESGINFISMKGPELLNMCVGESERAVRQVFQRARNSSPCLIFFDELDAIYPSRSGTSEGCSSVRAVNQLLTEMDGLEERKQVFIMAATNRPDIIDPAVLRPGRLDKTLYVGLPDCKDRLDILTTITKMGTKPQLASDVSLVSVAEDDRCTRYTGADLAALVREAAVSALREYLTSSRPLSDAISVTHHHFDIAFQKVKPSVSLKDMEVYSKMKMKHNLSS